MANVGVMEGMDVSVGGGVLDGSSVGVEVVVGVIGVAGSDDSNGAQETNIHVKQIPIHNRFCIADNLLSIQRGIDGLLKNRIGLRAFH